MSVLIRRSPMMPNVISGKHCCLLLGAAVKSVGVRDRAGAGRGHSAGATRKDFLGVALRTNLGLEAQGGDGRKEAAFEEGAFRRDAHPNDGHGTDTETTDTQRPRPRPTLRPRLRPGRPRPGRLRPGQARPGRARPPRPQPRRLGHFRSAHRPNPRLSQLLKPRRRPNRNGSFSHEATLSNRSLKLPTGRCGWCRYDWFDSNPSLISVHVFAICFYLCPVWLKDDI